MLPAEKGTLPWFVDEREELVVVGGDIREDCVDDFCLALQDVGPDKTIDMSMLEVDEGPSLAVIISTLRTISPCTLIEAPRMLAHTLYKINNQAISLRLPRSY